MGSCGVHFALTDAEADYLRSLSSGQDRRNCIEGDLKETYVADYEDYLAESERAWDAMHRALTDGQLNWDGGTYPLNHAILGGEALYTETDYVMSLKTPQQVRDVAAALDQMSDAEFRRRYFKIDATDYGTPLSEADLAYTWGWFESVRRLYRKAADENRPVLFTADE